MPKKYESLADIWKLKKRGKRDSDRHKELVEKAIRKNGKDLITEYNIIRSDGSKKIKVPIRFLEQYKVRYGKMNKKSQVGQGLNGAPGTKYGLGKGKKNAQGQGNKAGDQEGERIFEADISIDELVEILMDELGLPWMDPTNSSEVEIEHEELESIDRVGIFPNIDLKKSLLQNLKRNAAKGNPKIGGFVKEDLRYKTWDNQKEYHSNATIYLMMDRSASMTKEKTHIAKSYYFWMVQFLKKRYKNIELFFIAHDVKAFFCDEEEFFKVSAHGGTACSSAFKLAHEHINQRKKDNTNIYIMEFSDGDNFMVDNKLCVEYVEKLLPHVKAMGYCEVLLSDFYNSPWFKKEFLLSSVFEENIKRTRFVSTQIKSVDEVYDALKKFFNVDGAAKKSHG